MYTIFLDTNHIFECSVSVYGASTTNSDARLIVETPDKNLLFYGKIFKGKCEIPLPGLKSLFKEGDSGKLKLEIIADDTRFTPWSDNFITSYEKKITVENVSSVQNKKQVIVEMKNPQLDKIVGILHTNNINYKNLRENLSKVKRLINFYISENKISINNRRQFITEVINELSKQK